MKNLTILFVISFCVLLQISIQAQTRKTATREFLKQLNEIARKTSRPWPWDYKGKYSVDSAFSINKAGVLSITFRFSSGAIFTRIRMAAPVGKIQDIFYDYYLGLQFDQNLVTVFKTTPGNNKLKESSTEYLFHVGLPTYDGEQQKWNLKKALDEVQKYYKE